MLVEPAFEEPLQIGEINHAADVVDFLRRDVKVGDIIMTVKKFALAAVLVQPVAGAELDAAHDGEGHCGIPQRLLGNVNSAAKESTYECSNQ
jgi:hypothetical protein